MDTTCLVKGQRQTTTLNYEISTMWEMNPKENPSKKDFQTVNGGRKGHKA